MMATEWTSDDVILLKSMHGVFSLKEIAERLGRSAGSIRAKITKLGISKKVMWTDAEIYILVSAYEAAGSDGVVSLGRISEELGRDKANVCRKAKSLGLETNKNRRVVEARKTTRKHATIEDARAATAAAARLRIQTLGHPKGMKGKKHSDETRRVISAKSKAMFLMMSEEKKAEMYMKGMKTRERNGYGPPTIKRGSWKAGWREIGGKRNYYRSLWEANYARYLQWLKEHGEITEWKHEPETFWFEQIKRGVRSYKPDFRVWENSGISTLHEVKGWMDARSKTCLARMAKYHPSEKIILIDERQYKAIRLKMLRLISGWEDSERDKR